MAVLSAFKEQTAQNMQLDAGIILYDIVAERDGLNDGSFDVTTHLQKCIGATKGGATFSAVPEVRNILDGFNGVRGNYVGADTIDSWEITLKTTLSELSYDNLKMVMGTEEMTISPGTKYNKKLTSKLGIIKKETYKNIAWCGTLAGKKDPIVIFMNNVLNMNGVNVAATDKDSGSVEVEFKAHFELCSDEVPYAIYYPKA